ncbi:hypothetical protein ANN_27786 [Periplaneta americana]|uniref:Uncharacterized protein n=1 Tax=Periplaneta americana TaxID=6978 RepID=A0ABQ8RV81_PERAM|nr:hypothetical protein ANN_27786 [Periplaneta americana]
MPSKGNKSENIESTVQCVAKELFFAMLQDIGMLQKTIYKNTEVINNLTTTTEQRDKQISDLANKIEDIEQYQRRHCIQIFGILKEIGENKDKIAVELARNIRVDVQLMAPNGLLTTWPCPERDGLARRHIPSEYETCYFSHLVSGAGCPTTPLPLATCSRRRGSPDHVTKPKREGPTRRHNVVAEICDVNGVITLQTTPRRGEMARIPSVYIRRGQITVDSFVRRSENCYHAFSATNIFSASECDIPSDVVLTADIPSRNRNAPVVLSPLSRHNLSHLSSFFPIIPSIVVFPSHLAIFFALSDTLPRKTVVFYPGSPLILPPLQRSESRAKFASLISAPHPIFIGRSRGPCLRPR